MYYYGARYYDPRISIWASVDPLAEKMPIWSPYSYSYQNPIKYKDAGGLFPYPWWLSESSRLGTAAHLYLAAFVSLKGGGWTGSAKASTGGRYGTKAKIDVAKIIDKKENYSANIFELKPISHGPGSVYYNGDQKQLAGYTTGLFRDALAANPNRNIKINQGSSTGDLPFYGVLPATVTTLLYEYDIEYTIPNPHDGMIYYQVINKKLREWVTEAVWVAAFALTGVLIGPAVGPAIFAIRSIITVRRAVLATTIIVPIITNGQTLESSNSQTPL